MYDIKDHSLLQILEALRESEITIEASGNYTDKEGILWPLTIFDNNYFTRNILVKYRTRKVTLWDSDIASAFQQLFTSWWESRKDLYLKQAYAYKLKYNPIENYSSIENMIDDTTVHEKDTQNARTMANSDTTTHADTMTRTHNDTVSDRPAETTSTTTHPTETQTTTPYGSTITNNPGKITTHSTKGFNSASFVDTDKDTESGSSTETTTHQGSETIQTTYAGTDSVASTTQTAGSSQHTGTITDGHTGSTTLSHTGTITDVQSGSDTDIRNYTLTKSGNIGVQTAAEMLQREYDGLSQDLAFRCLADFLDHYTFYRDIWEG